MLPLTPGFPAKVVTTPAGVTFRIVLFAESATIRFPLVGSSAMPTGVLNCAAPPVPSALPETPRVPAIVVTTPAWVIFLMLLLAWSVT